MEEFRGFKEHMVNGMVQAWTDGAYTRKGSAQEGTGAVFYAPECARNLTIQIPNCQNAARAELAAITEAIEGAELRPLGVKSDAKWTVDALNNKLSKMRARAYFKKPLKAVPFQDGDLWRRAAKALDKRKLQGQITEVSWIKGHGTKEDVQKGRTTKLDAWGNACAHELAQAAKSGSCKKHRRNEPPRRAGILQVANAQPNRWGDPAYQVQEIWES
jgi:ribonuclease HI